MPPGDRIPPKSAKPAPRPSTAKPSPTAGSKSAPKKPVAAGDKVTAAYQDLLLEIADKKKRDAAELKRRPKKRDKGAIVRATLAVILPPIVAIIWIFQPFAPPPPAPIRPPDDPEVWQAALLGVARRVSAWRDSTGYLPAKIEGAGVDLPGISYDVMSESTFVLRSFAQDRAVAVFVDGHRFGVNAPPVVAPPPEPQLVP